MFNLKTFVVPTYRSEVIPNTMFLGSNRITNLLGYMLQDALINILKDVFVTTPYMVEINIIN